MQATTAEVIHPLILSIWVNGITLSALVDSGAQGNYVSPRVVNRFQIPWVWKERPYPLLMIDGAPTEYDQGMVNRETQPLEVGFRNKKETIVFDITDVSEHDIVLGIPWLRRSNPRID